MIIIDDDEDLMSNVLVIDGNEECTLNTPFTLIDMGPLFIIESINQFITKKVTY